MRTFNIQFLLLISALILLSSCEHDDPKAVKRRGERQIYVLTAEGY